MLSLNSVVILGFLMLTMWSWDAKELLQGLRYFYTDLWERILGIK